MTAQRSAAPRHPRGGSAGRAGSASRSAAMRCVLIPNAAQFPAPSSVKPSLMALRPSRCHRCSPSSPRRFCRQTSLMETHSRPCCLGASCPCGASFVRAHERSCISAVGRSMHVSKAMTARGRCTRSLHMLTQSWKSAAKPDTNNLISALCECGMCLSSEPVQAPCHRNITPTQRCCTCAGHDFGLTPSLAPEEARLDPHSTRPSKRSASLAFGSEPQLDEGSLHVFGDVEQDDVTHSAGSRATLRDDSDAMLFGSGDESLALLATSGVQRLMAPSGGRGRRKHALDASGACVSRWRRDALRVQTSSPGIPWPADMRCLLGASTCSSTCSQSRCWKVVLQAELVCMLAGILIVTVPSFSSACTPLSALSRCRCWHSWSRPS
jgi:hypothetical protein